MKIQKFMGNASMIGPLGYFLILLGLWAILAKIYVRFSLSPNSFIWKKDQIILLTAHIVKDDTGYILFCQIGFILAFMDFSDLW